MSQTIQERQACIVAWEQSKYFPVGLLQTENNFSVLGGALQAFESLTIPVIVDTVNRLGDIANGGKLQYAQRQPEVKAVIEYREKPKTAEQLRAEQRVRSAAIGITHTKTIKTEFDRCTADQDREDKNHQIHLAQKAHADEFNAKINYVIEDRTTGRTHGRALATKVLLRGLRDQLVKSGATPEAVLEAVIKKQQELLPE
jgi:hypothetical protein